MELDKRIKEGKRPLTCFDVEIAKQFIGKECYFSDSPRSFANIDNIYIATLTSIDEEDIHPYKLEDTRWRYATNLILPYEWIKEPEKEEPKYRPYKKHEFLNKFECGEPINIRRKDDHTGVFIETISSIKIDNLSDDVHVRLFEGVFNLKRLFDEFEWQKSNGEWQPFGIKE